MWALENLPEERQRTETPAEPQCLWSSPVSVVGPVRFTSPADPSKGLHKPCTECKEVCGHLAAYPTGLAILQSEPPRLEGQMWPKADVANHGETVTPRILPK